MSGTDVTDSRKGVDQQSHLRAAAGFAVALLIISAAWRLGDVFNAQMHDAAPLAYERTAPQDVPRARELIQSDRDWKNELVKMGLLGTTSEAVDVGTSTPSIVETLSDQFITGYVALKESGRYTESAANELGRTIGSHVRAPSHFVLHGESDMKKDVDTSSERVLEYRADMRDALSVLVSDAPPEFEQFGLYIETKNPARLLELEEAVGRYKHAEENLLTVTVPQDAVAIHVRVVNALGLYADSLKQLIRYADEPLSTLAVLRTYNDAEREMLYAFDALSSYYVRKSSDN